MPAVSIKEWSKGVHRGAVLVRASLTNAREKSSGGPFLVLGLALRAVTLSLQRGTLLSRVSFLWTLRRARACVYHSQPMINCAWRNILTASFLSAFKYRAKRARRNSREREEWREWRWRRRQRRKVYRGTLGKRGGGGRVVPKGEEPLTLLTRAA